MHGAWVWCMVHGAWETWVMRQSDASWLRPAEVLSPQSSQHARSTIQDEDDHALQRQACLPAEGASSGACPQCVGSGAIHAARAEGCVQLAAWRPALALVCTMSISTMQRLHGGALHLAGSSCDLVQRATIIPHRRSTWRPPLLVNRHRGTPLIS